MKKILFFMLSLLVAMTMFAQNDVVRKMNLIYDGQVVYSRNVNLIDSIKFILEESGDDVIGGGEVDSTKQLYVGVVAFNQNVRQMPITSDVDAVKAFINEQTNDKDFTSFAYSVSKGNQMFDAEALPTCDKIFMLNFSDGTDNYSNMKWGEEGRMVSQRNVYDTARYDLQQRDGLNSYALGFGDDVGFGANMQKVVMGSGTYFNVTSANELQSTFNEIAQSMLASAKNVLLKTNPGYYVGGDCKYFRFIFTAEGGYTDTIYAQMEGYPAIGYTLTISKVSNNYAYFAAPAKGKIDAETGKVHIPLNNVKFTKDGKELQYKFVIEFSFDGKLYYKDVEEASTAEEIDKRIAVVLVLDCSTSMGDAFEPMKAAAIEFIKTMEKMEVDDSEPNIPDVPNPTTGVTYNVTVPAGTYACYIAGEMNGWTQQKMTKVNDTHYSITIADATTAMKYKYCSGPAWAYREMTATGEEVADRTYAENDVVEAWTAVYNEGGEAKNITIKAKVPAAWIDQITAWVWGTGMEGQEIVPTQVGEWYVYTQYCTELNIIFKNGTGWTGDKNQTIDMNFTESTCIEITADGVSKATYTVVDCHGSNTPNTSENGHEWVDLGLSVKWATCNVGANKAEEHGDYFAWGETTTKTDYYWDTYKHCNGTWTNLTKYNTDSYWGVVDNKTTLDLIDDAVRANWGGSWRMPTYDELVELREECTWIWTTQNGISGYKVSSKTNGNSIFLPTTGCSTYESLVEENNQGHYWSSSLNENYPPDAWRIFFYNSSVTVNADSRDAGRAIRPVCP